MGIAEGGHKRIAKNTLFMYIRLLVTMPVAFITSRFVLNELGVSDYGIYNAVAGIVMLFSTLRAAFASATQRFYNVSLGQKDNKVPEIFTTSFLIHLLIAFILVKYTDSPVPYGDSFTTALSILGMWLLAKKHVEQWWFWFVVNIISCALYAWKGLYTTSILFGIYSIISVFGYFKWKKMMLNQT